MSHLLQKHIISDGVNTFEVLHNDEIEFTSGDGTVNIDTSVPGIINLSSTAATDTNFFEDNLTLTDPLRTHSLGGNDVAITGTDGSSWFTTLTDSVTTATTSYELSASPTGAPLRTIREASRILGASGRSYQRYLQPGYEQKLITGTLSGFGFNETIDQSTGIPYAFSVNQSAANVDYSFAIATTQTDELFILNSNQLQVTFDGTWFGTYTASTGQTYTFFVSGSGANFRVDDGIGGNSTLDLGSSGTISLDSSTGTYLLPTAPPTNTSPDFILAYDSLGAIEKLTPTEFSTLIGGNIYTTDGTISVPTRTVTTGANEVLFTGSDTVVRIQSTAALGVQAFHVGATTGGAATMLATGGTAVLTVTQNGGDGVPLYVDGIHASTNTIRTLITTARNTSGAGAASGIGSRINSTIENSTGSLVQVSTIDTILDVVTSGLEESRLDFRLLNLGVVGRVLSLDGNGQITIDVLPTVIATGEDFLFRDSGTGQVMSNDFTDTATKLQNAIVLREEFVTITSVDSPYSVQATDEVIFADTSGGPIVINMPSSASMTSTGKTRRITIKLTSSSAGANTLTIEPDGAETIQLLGAPAANIVSNAAGDQGTSWPIVSDSLNLFVI